MGFRENLENGVKNTIKKVTKIFTKPLKRFLIIGIAIVIVIISLGGSYNALAEEFSKKVSEHMKSNPVKYNATDGSIDITDDDINSLIKLLENMGTDINKLKLTKEQLKKIYAAELVTTEINKGVAEMPGKYYGRVYVKRAGNSTEDLKNMTYLNTLQDLETKVQEYKNCAINSEEKLRNELLTYYTVDGQGQICFVDNINSQIKNGAITKTATIQKQPYKDKISQFVVPVEFLIDICFISQNSGFTMALVDKILNETKINIAILQTTNHKNTQTTYRYEEEKVSYTEKVSVDKEGKVMDRVKSDDATTTTEQPEVITAEGSTYVSAQLKITSVESWFMNLKYNYNRIITQINNSIPENDPSNIIEDEPATTPVITLIKNEPKNDGSYTNTYTVEETRKVNQTRRVDITGSTEIYQESVSQVQNDKTDDIINMLKAGYNVPGTFNKVSPLGNLESGSGIFFNMLAGGERTQSLEQLMRYILGKASGNDYGVSSFDFNVFNVVSFNSTIGSTRSLADYLRQFSHSGEAPKSSDGKYYKMYGDGAGWPTIGNADIQWKSHASKFEIPGKVLENGTEKDVTSIRSYVNGFLSKGETAEYTNSEIDNMEIYVETGVVDEVGNQIQSVYYNAVEAYTRGLNLSKQQLYALTAIQYNFGSLPERNGYTFRKAYEDGAALYEVNSWEHNKFIWDNWWCYIAGGSAGHIPSRDAAFETYVKGIYDFSQSSAGEVFGRNCYIYYTQAQIDYLKQNQDVPNKTITRTSSNEQEIFSYVKKFGNGIIDVAEEIHNIMEEQNWTYSVGGDLYWNDIEMSTNNPNKVTCCATYVSSVLYSAGYLTEEETNSFNYNAANGLYDYLSKTKHWKEITSYDDLEAGDIVFMTVENSSGIGHVQIYAGDGKWYNAGSTNAIQRDSPYTSDARSKFVAAIRAE